MTAPRTDVTFDSVLTRSDDVLFQEVGGEAVLLDLASEQYFGLNPVGTRVWDLLADRPKLHAVRDRLLAEYDAPREQIEADLLALAQALTAAGLTKAE